jgi:hypothetical protein
MEPMVLTNSPDIHLNGKGLRLPSGTYEIEAEDARYLYYRAPSAIEYRVVIQGKTDQQFIPGGIALPKATFDTGAVYADFKIPGQRLVTRALGTEFLLEERRKWKRNP